MQRLYSHWREIPEGTWRWPSFSPEEIACRGTGAILVHEEALDRLQALREKIGKPMIVNSAYRSPEHNRKVGGAPRSKHPEGHAYDISMANHDPVQFEKEANALGFLGIGHYPNSNFMHIDLGPVRRWNEGGWFKPRPDNRFGEEAPRPLERAKAARDTGLVGGTGAIVTVAPVALEALEGQEDAFGSGDYVRIAFALVIFGLTVLIAVRQLGRRS
ncbi:YcbK family protein [Pelagibacterium montanilacus]|uniref:YcbK family protein n=1 Tax=Pelagibacterium montanilacus TaxID=2185280 RepID=UPI000F8C4326|nr:D-Ala-D-Ala carboxypeptidase family metallohydrolase [Pelagibacterium montanilacus]